MKKLTIFIGSVRKGGTYGAAQQFAKELKTHCDAEVEYVFLSKCGLDMCRGCKLCFDRGEECCPLKDGRDELIAGIERSDGVIFATPNYAFHVSGMMKNFIDRLTFNFHRPRYFGKTFTSIVAQGAFGGGAIVKYLTATGENMGFTASKGCVVKTIEPTPEKDREKNHTAVKKAAKRYAKALNKAEMPKPSALRLFMFRLTRHGIRAADQNLKDFRHYSKMGWFESDYYYKIDLGLIKKALGGLGDVLGKQMAKASK